MNPDDDDSVVGRDVQLADRLVRCHGCERIVIAGSAPDEGCIRTITALHWQCRAINPSGQREPA